jgi:hypothetical protein
MMSSSDDIVCHLDSKSLPCNVKHALAIVEGLKVIQNRLHSILSLHIFFTHNKSALHSVLRETSIREKLMERERIIYPFAFVELK